MLEYENQMMLDLLHEDGLLIAARGLGLERILIGLLTSFSDAGNLVLVIGANPQEGEHIISQLDYKGVVPLPKYVTAECPVGDRAQMYLDGGCLFVTSRILVVDFLTNRVPAEFITGIIVWRAHQILETCQEAFILRLYRQKNKRGFIKALSGSPLSFTQGFCHVERVMKNLFVKKLYLWPRFLMGISSSFENNKPEVIELHVEMSKWMHEIQMAILDLISTTLQELKLSNRAINTEEFNTENAISRSFEKMLKIQLDLIWHQLSTRTKQLVADIKVLRTVLNYLTQYDSVTFYNLVSSLWSTEKAIKSAGWMFLPSAESLHLHAKLRVFGESAVTPLKKLKSDDVEKKKREVDPEVNPKWLVLSEILDEIRKETEGNQSKKLEKCLVVALDDRTCQQLKEFLVYGGKNMLERTFYRTVGPKLGYPIPSHVYMEPMVNNSKVEPTLPTPKKYKGKGGAGKAKNTKKSTDNDKPSKNDEITLTQINQKYDFIGKEDIEIAIKDLGSDSPHAEEQEFSKRLLDKLLILIHPLTGISNPFALTDMLYDVMPKYIVMYDCDLSFVRRVEVWQANNSVFKSRVFFLIYKGTVEEQIYLTSIKREKDAFEYLIKEKANLVMPEYADGRSDDHPDLERHYDGEEELTGNEKTRKGGGGVVGKEVQPQDSPTVVVDMREFRSELPSLIHKRGIDIEPATIEVGDYILTPEICVERKSVSDLIGSLNSGRLYTQAQAMTRHYKKPILLIEFDEKKPFYFQSNLVISNDGSSSSHDEQSKLILLTIHFPMLRIIWSQSPYATAELFQLIKKGKSQPSVSEAQAITSETKAEFDSDKYNSHSKEFLLKLPGVNNKNVYSILRGCNSLKELVGKPESDISEMIGSGKHGKQLYNALHMNILEADPEDTVPKSGRGRLKTKFGKRVVPKSR